MDKTLREIVGEVCVEFGNRVTDKHRSSRQHLSLYEQLLPPHRYTAKKVVEIGVNRGGSIRTWQKFFPNATIYGADIRNKTLANIRGLDRVVPFHLDQSKAEDLARLAAEGPFDVFIDDGSHIWSHQIATFETIWPSIAPGGVYVLEDTCTSYDHWLDTEGKTRVSVNYNDQPLSCMEYFKKLLDHLNFDGQDYNHPDQAYSDFQRTIDLICFRTNVVYITKRTADRDPWDRSKV